MAEEIRLDVVSEAHSEGLTKAAGDLKATRAEADKFDDSLKKTNKDAFNLNEQIEHTRTRVRELREEFSRTGGKGLLGDLNSQESLLRKLERVAKDIKDDLSAGPGPIGLTVTNDFAHQISSAFSGASGTPGIGPVLIGALVEAATLAAPTVGAVLGGSLAGAAGAGAMALGILSAAKDQRVQSAADEFGKTVSAMFFGGGDAFVGPILKSLDILEHGFADMHVGDALAKLAPVVPVIAQGISDLGTRFMPGFNKALDRMGPLADAGAKGLGDVGDALGSFMDDITNSPGTVEGLKTAFTILDGTIRLLGKSLEGLSDAFHYTNKVGAHVFGDLKTLFASVGLDGLAEKAGKANDNFERITGSGSHLHGVFSMLKHDTQDDPFAGYLKTAWQQMDRLREETEATNKALTDYFHIVMSIDQAQLSVNKGLLDLKETLKENGRHWEDNTKAGLANREALQQQIENVERLREAEIAAGGDTGQANAKFYEQVNALLKIAGQAGATKEYLDRLQGEYIIRLSIVGGALELLGQIQRALSGFAGSGGGGGSTNRRESFAGGGDTHAFVPFEVHSGEILFSNRQHYVATAAQSRALMSGGGGPVEAVLSSRGISDPAMRALADALFPHFRVVVRGYGGAQAAFN